MRGMLVVTQGPRLTFGSDTRCPDAWFAATRLSRVSPGEPRGEEGGEEGEPRSDPEQVCTFIATHL